MLRVGLPWKKLLRNCLEMDLGIFKSGSQGLPWWTSSWDSEFPMQGTWVPSLVRELDPTCYNYEFKCCD